MKHFYTLISVLLVQVGISQEILPNKSFEDWTEYGADLLDGFNTSTHNFLNEAALPDTNFVEKSNDAVAGSYSLKLKTIDYNEDTYFGFAINGDWGDMGPTGGKPYSFDGDSVVFSYKCDIMLGDTAWVFIIPKKNGSNLAQYMLPITGTQSEWTRMALPAFLAQAPDTVFFGAVSSNVLEDDENAVAGSWIQLDNAGMTNMLNQFEAFPNGSFENWTDTIVPRLDDWFDVDYTSSRSTDATDGMYSLKLEVNSFEYGNGSVDTAGAIAANYNFETNVGLNDLGNINLESYTGDFKYEPAGTDTGRIAIVLYYGDGWVAGLDTALTQSTGNTWSNFAFDLSSLDGVDSIRVYFTAGEFPGSTLMIDNLNISEQSVSVEEITFTHSAIYPNPTTGVVNILNPENVNQYTVIDLTGKTVQNGILNNGQIDLSKINQGIYLIQLQKENGDRLTEKVILK
jgi:hypothetical protein